MGKSELIQNYINECNNYKKNGIPAEKLVKEIVSVFGPEIEDITDGLYYCSPQYSFGFRDSPDKEYENDIELLKAKLENYKCNIELEQNKSQKPLVNINNTLSVSISFEQTISAISALPNKVLPSDEKEILQGKLSQLNALSGNKKKFWNKAQDVLKWIADKGVEVGIAALPYIVECLKK